jgi:hypothetical protein
LLFALLGFTDTQGQVNITKPNLDISSCSFPSNYFTLTRIQIEEDVDDDIQEGSNITLILSAPANFEFNPGVGTVSVRGGRNLSNSSFTISSTTITINFNCNDTDKRDRIRIDGIQVRAINNASSGNITRTGGTAIINGLTNGTTLTNSLNSFLLSPNLVISPNVTLCKNTIHNLTADAGNSNAIAYSEDFSSETGWNNSSTNSGLDADYNNSNDAGGSAPEMRVERTNNNRNGEILVYPVDTNNNYLPVNILNFQTLFLDFKYFYDKKNDVSREIFVEVSVDGVNFTTVWNTVPSSSNNSSGTPNIDLSNCLGNSNLYFRFRYNGNSNGLNNWFIDDIIISGTKQNTVTWSPTTDLYTDASCTVPYSGEHATTLYAKPTQTRSYTVTTIASNGCSTSANVTLSVESAAWNGTSWLSAPAANKGLIFNGDFSSTESLEGCSCTVNSGTVVINSEHSVKLLDEITVNGGSITFENNSSLIQINDVSNSGSIIYKRTSPEQVLNTDYVYWSSPLSGTTVPGGLNYLWNNGAGASGNWASAAGQTMTAGQGVIMRGIGSRTFTGVPHNGEIMVNVHRRNLPGYTDNWNLIGNPYPSAISADEFLTDSNNTAIEGSIAIWTHGTAPSNGVPNPFYGSFVYNYTPNDYIIYNLTGSQSGPDTYNGFIPAGQGFFVKYDNDDNASPTAASSTIKFKNSMRLDASGSAYSNTQFFRNSENATQNLEKNRIWIDIVNGANAYSRTVVGYIENATDGKDRLYDSSSSVTPSTTSIYSLIGNDKMCIQGKGLPFSDLDEIPMGYNAGQAGNFTIAIHAIDGLFFNQDIFLFDTELNITHNLKLNPYVFSTIQGENNTRFRLIFNDQTLSNPDFDIEKSLFIVNKNKLEVISNMEQIEAITVFDLLGRTVYMNNNVNNKEFVIPVTQEHAPLIVKIKLANGTYIERKTIF